MDIGSKDVGQVSYDLPTSSPIHHAPIVAHAIPIVELNNDAHLAEAGVPMRLHERQLQENTPITGNASELEKGYPSAHSISPKRQKLYLLVAVLVVIVVVAATVVSVQPGKSSSKSSNISSTENFQPTLSPTIAPVESSTNNTAINTSPDGTVTACLGISVPDFAPLPPNNDTGICQVLNLYLTSYATGNLDADGRNWTGTCSCTNTDTGATATCRYNC